MNKCRIIQPALSTAWAFKSKSLRMEDEGERELLKNMVDKAGREVTAPLGSALQCLANELDPQ